jgi:hypothetical protein
MGLQVFCNQIELVLKVQRPEFANQLSTGNLKPSIQQGLTQACT